MFKRLFEISAQTLAPPLPQPTYPMGFNEVNRKSDGLHIPMIRVLGIVTRKQ